MASIVSRQRATRLDTVLGAVPAIVLFAIGMLNLARGGFHWLSPDSGAGSVAGMQLTYPNAKDVIFLLASDGVLRIASGVWYIYFARWRRDLVPLGLATECVASALVLITELTFKSPAAPIPNRFADVTTITLTLVALGCYFLARSRRSQSG